MRCVLIVNWCYSDHSYSQVRKYGHVYPVCREGAAAVILAFSFIDRTTWEEYVA